MLLADSDAVFLQSPELAFSHPGYIKTGTLFFHDRVDPGPYLSYVNNVMPVHEWWHSIMHGRQPSPMLEQSQFWKGKTIHEMESGVVVVNKGNTQVLLGILFAAWMNTKKVRRTTTYRYTHGETSLPLHKKHQTSLHSYSCFDMHNCKCVSANTACEFMSCTKTTS